MVVWRKHEDGSQKYSIDVNDAWRFTGGTSAGGRPFLDIQTKDFASGESTAVFFERHRQELLEAAQNYAVFELGLTRGETVGLRNYIHLEYLWRPTSNDCLYHVVEHIFRSRFYPVRDHGFIITAGVCENEHTFYQKQRTDVLASFEELE